MHPTELPLSNSSTITDRAYLQSNKCPEREVQQSYQRKRECRRMKISLFTLYSNYGTLCILLSFVEGKRLAVWIAPAVVCPEDDIFRLGRGEGSCNNVGLQILR